MAYLAVAWLLAGSRAHSQTAELPRLLLIDRATAPARLGERATLTVSPLKRRDDRFVGSYTVTVAPLPIANEAGSFEVALPPDSLRNLVDKRPIAFKGNATNDAGKPRTITGTATPKDARGGAIQIDVISERGTLRYNTTYRLPAAAP